MVMENDHPPTDELEPREPTVEDLALLCRELNRLDLVFLRHWFEARGEEPSAV